MSSYLDYVYPFLLVLDEDGYIIDYLYIRREGYESNNHMWKQKKQSINRTNQ